MGLYITNFSIPENSTVYCTSLLDFSVDVLDDVNIVTLSGTYLSINNETTVYVTTPITNGYRLNCSTTPSGTIWLEVFGSNNLDETINTLYILQFGYEIEWEKVVVWPNNKEVPVSVSANNNVYNSNTMYYSTFFKTSDYKEYNLEACISVEGSGQLNLAASIFPQSKYFMYGNSYSITISGIKDFSGNTLPVKTYNFTLESNPNI
jgi:hypothetical protein